MPDRGKKDDLRVAELFAGVGGFRLGLERASERFRNVWSNQWEPSTKRQQASEIYVARFSAEGHSNKDISTVPLDAIPDHDLLVGGFPCQDYSVARTLNKADGLAGKKGVLWWQIHRILKGKRPKAFFLENVDRLLNSPAKQRGRDFAVMLASLAELGYVAEWRVINAADYGMPQRRRRIFILGYEAGSPIGQAASKAGQEREWMLRKGVLAEAFPAKSQQPFCADLRIDGDLADVTEQFNKTGPGAKSPFENAGLLVGRQVFTLKVEAAYDGPRTNLGDVLLPETEVPGSFFIPGPQVKDWTYLKGGKKEERVNKLTGFTYHYAEGAMTFPDALDKPSRTVITGEGGAGPSRFKHVVHMADGRLRRLMPVEIERLNMFPDGHTSGVSDSRRAFLMGNALVVGVIERVGTALAKRISE